MTNPLAEAAAEIEQFCNKQQLRCCIVGGVAVQRWGEPRTTLDVDFNSYSELGDERRLLKVFSQQFEFREEFTPDLALNNRIILLYSSNGTPIDMSLGYTEYEKEVIDRATRFQYSDATGIFTCSAEDLIILKSVAARTGDWADIRGVLVRQHGHLNWQQIMSHVEMLAETRDDVDIIDCLSRIRKEVDQLIARMATDPPSPNS